VGKLRIKFSQNGRGHFQIVPGRGKRAKKRGATRIGENEDGSEDYLHRPEESTEGSTKGKKGGLVRRRLVRARRLKSGEKGEKGQRAKDWALSEGLENKGRRENSVNSSSHERKAGRS